MKILLIVIIILLIIDLLSYIEFIIFYKKNKNEKKRLSIRLNVSMILTGLIAILSVAYIFLKVING